LETAPEAKNIRYDVIKIPALDENDESNFNYKYGVGYSTEYYKARRATFEMNNDMAGWFAQCQQEPIDRTNAVFTPETMRYYDFLPGGEPIKVIAHCDVALGGGDFLAFPVAYYYENPDGSLSGYVEDVVFDNSEKHITQPQVLAAIQNHHIRQVHFESNQGGEGYKDDIQRLLKDSGYKEVCNISSSWAPVTKRKQQRIWDDAQCIRELYFKDNQHRSDQYRKFMTNLFGFTMNMSKKAHDDAADALAGLVDFEKNGSGVRKTVVMRGLF
jgi:predicted phage terminase large subunit-like protein